MFLSCPIITSTIINAVWKMSLFNLYFTVPQAGLWIRIRIHFPSWIRFQYADPDPGEKNFRKRLKKCQEIGRNFNFILKIK